MILSDGGCNLVLLLAAACSIRMLGSSFDWAAMSAETEADQSVGLLALYAVVGTPTTATAPVHLRSPARKRCSRCSSLPLL